MRLACVPQEAIAKLHVAVSFGRAPFFEVRIKEQLIFVREEGKAYLVLCRIPTISNPPGLTNTMTTNAHSSAAAPSPFAPPPEVVEDAYSVPAFSPEDEQRERQSLTEEERRRIVADLCGLADGMAGLRVSTAGGAKMAVDGACNTKSEAAADKETLRTPEEIERDMNLLNAELDAIPQDEKEAYLLALLQCPHQLFGGWRGEVIVEMQQQEGAGGRGTVFDAKVSFEEEFSVSLCVVVLC